MQEQSLTVLDPSGRPVDPATIENIRRTSDPSVPTTSRVVYRPRTTSGAVITPDTALTIPAVHACIRYLSQTVAKLPWRIKREVGTNSNLVPGHPLDRMLRRRVSPEWSSFQFRETMMSWALRWGNAYAEIERDEFGRAIALWPIHPSRVCVMRDRVTWDLYYDVAGNERYGNVQFDPLDVFHIRGFGEGPVGISVMAYAAESLGWVKAAQLFGAGFFGHGAQLAGVVQMKKALTPEALKVLREQFQELYGGPKKSNNVAFLDNEMEYQSIGIEPDKGQFIETNQHLVDEVCRWFGVPPHKIYHLLRATFSNIEHQSIEVVEDSIRPWTRRFEDEADYKLLQENRTGLYSQIEVKRLLRPDTKTRMEYYRGLNATGSINADEIRDEEDMNALPAGAGGDKYVMQSGFTTLEKIGEDPPPPAEPEEDPEPEPEDEQTNAVADRILKMLGIEAANDDASSSTNGKAGTGAAIERQAV